MALTWPGSNKREKWNDKKAEWSVCRTSTSKCGQFTATGEGKHPSNHVADGKAAAQLERRMHNHCKKHGCEY